MGFFEGWVFETCEPCYLVVVDETPPTVAFHGADRNGCFFTNIDGDIFGVDSCF